MPDGISLQRAVEMVREYHRKHHLPVAESPRLLPTDGFKAIHLSARLLDSWIEVHNMQSSQEFLVPASAAEDQLVRLALKQLELLGQWVKAHVEGDLEAAGDAWCDRFYLLLQEAVAAGLPVEQLFTLLHEINMSDEPAEGPNRAGSA